MYINTQITEVGLTEIGFLCIKRLQKGLHLSCSVRWSYECIYLISKGYQSRFVITTHSNVGQDQRSIYTIIEKRHSTERLLHDTPLINHREYLLRTLITIDIHHKLVATCTCFPVYTTVVIPFHIVFYLLKLRIVTHTTNTFYTHLCEVIAHCKKFIAI